MTLLEDADAELVGPAAPDPAALVRVGAARAPDVDPHLVYLAGLSTEKSRRTQRTALRVVAGLIGSSPERLAWERLRYQHTSAIRTRLAERYAPATVNRFLSAIRGVLLEARRLGLMSAEDCAAASDVKPAKGERLPAGRALARAEIKRLFAAAAADPLAGRRDAAIVALLFGCGLRRSELVALDLVAFDPGAGALRVLGKGNKERLAYVAAGRPALDGWLESRGAEPGPLFLPISSTGTFEFRRLSDDAVRGILARLARRARVKKFSPHDLRRTFISTLLDAGADLSVVQQLAGHAQVTTTQRYDRRGEAAKQRAAKLIKI